MNVPVEILEALLTHELALAVWPFFRIAGVLMVAPVFGARLVPVRVRLAMSVAATIALAPLLPPAPPFALSIVSGFTVAQEVLIGVAMGFCLQMIFDALIIAGQTLATGMGLSMATMVDPQRAVSVPIVGQFFLILGMLIFLSMEGHLAVVRLVADSFEILPLGEPLSANGVWSVAAWGSQMFANALRIALPAATALLVANIAFGVMSRAAPTLNLFAVGLPAGLLVGFLLLLLNIGHLSALLAEFLDSTLTQLAQLLAS